MQIQCKTDALLELSESIDWQILVPDKTLLPNTLHATRCSRFRTLLADATRESEVYFGRDHLSAIPDAHLECCRLIYIVATCKHTKGVVGSARLAILNNREFNITPEMLFQLGGVSIPNAHDSSMHETALQTLLDRHKASEWFIYVGSLFVTEKWQRSFVGVSLGLSANYIFRQLKCRLGASFATEKNNAAKLFCRLGGYRLSANGDHLNPFFCHNHQSMGQLLGMDPERSESRFEPFIAYLAQHYQDNQRILSE